MAVAVLGTGAMGSAMVRRLLMNNYNVVAWNRTRVKAERLKTSEKIAVATEAKEAINSANVALLALWDDNSIQQLLEGLTQKDLAGRSLVCTMTISPARSKEFFDIVTSKGGEWIESPVLGNQFVADEGKLQVCVGGTKEQYERLVPILSSLGTPRYIGDVGKASTLKLALNYILGANVVAFSNAYGLMEEAGVDTNMFIAVLNNGPLSLAGGYYKYAEIKKLLILPASDGIKKDLTLAKNEMASHGINTSAAEGLLNIINEASEQYGKGNDDFTAVYESSNPNKD